jgi:hypothetical protein
LSGFCRLKADRIIDARAAGHDAAVQMTDTSFVLVHRPGARIADNNYQDTYRLRGPDEQNSCGGGPQWRQSISLSCLVRRTTTGCVRFLSAPCFHPPMLLADCVYDADWIRELVGQQCQRVATLIRQSWRPTIWPSSSSRQSAFGRVPMSPHPKSRPSEF